MRGVKAKLQRFFRSRPSDAEVTRLYRLGDELRKRVRRALKQESTAEPPTEDGEVRSQFEGERK